MDTSAVAEAGDPLKKVWGLSSCKRLDSGSVVSSEGIRTQKLDSTMEQCRKEEETSKTEGATSSTISNRHEQVTKCNSSLSLVQGGSCLSRDSVGYVHPSPNSDRDFVTENSKNTTRSSLSISLNKENSTHMLTTTGLGVDLNALDVPSRVEHNPFYPYKRLGEAKPSDASECGSTTGPSEESEPLKMWKKMKQNGFLTSSHGGIPLPKKRGRQFKKRKYDEAKKKTEIAKKEQIIRYTNIAAPSGLLSRLDPGIIKHVRNSKQVHSIIEAIVRSEKSDAHTQNIFTSHMERGESKETSDRRKDSGCGTLEFKPSSAVTMGSDIASNASGDNLSPTSLSFKAACVASQWMELLQLDIKGRLAALRRSKKRVKNVIQTELPYLLSTEIPSNLEPDHCARKLSGAGYLVPDMHVARWKSLFSQMDKALYEEAKHLESWLGQVQDMQLHCDKGLKHIGADGSSQQGSLEDSRKPRNSEEMECAVVAAAASIYSTCNLTMSKENLPCF